MVAKINRLAKAYDNLLEAVKDLSGALGLINKQVGASSEVTKRLVAAHVVLIDKGVYTDGEINAKLVALSDQGSGKTEGDLLQPADGSEDAGDCGDSTEQRLPADAGNRSPDGSEGLPAGPPEASPVDGVTPDPSCGVEGR